MDLKNSFHTELAIGILLNDEKELETKLELLTEIGLISKNEETFRICEKFRSRLCSGQEKTGRTVDLHPIHKVRTKRSPRKEITNATNGAE
jgi:hypothetical protein